MPMGSKPKPRTERASAAEPREIELKLELASGKPDALLAHPALAEARPLTRQGGDLRAIYYDTPDQALRRAGISLRIRHREGEAIQTIKAQAPDRGLAMERGEWETPVSDGLDLSAAAGTPLSNLLSDGAIGQSLKPLFTVETKRQAFEVARDGAVIELALDRSKASASGRSEPFAEIELELKEGEPARLFELARDLSQAAPLRLSTVAKSERGYRLVAEEPDAAIRATKIVLPEDASCAEAFQIIARSCLSQMVQNEPLVRRMQNPTALHQMRVGLRRLRAAISLFKAQLLTDKETEALREDLRWAGQAMGEARDLDVFLARLRETQEVDPSQIEAVERRREEAYRSLLETLESPRFMGIVLHTAAWIEAGDWAISNERERARGKPIKDFADKELARRWKRIRQIAKNLRELDDEALHALRIRIKKLRYGSEFFASLFPGKEARKRHKALLAILENLQETLGELNDLAVSGALTPAPPADDVKKHRARLLDKAEAQAAKLTKAEPFWA